MPTESLSDTGRPNNDPSGSPPDLASWASRSFALFRARSNSISVRQLVYVLVDVSTCDIGTAREATRELMRHSCGLAIRLRHLHDAVLLTPYRITERTGLSEVDDIELLPR